MLPTEQIPRWAAFWLASGHNGTAFADLAGLHGEDPHEVRDLLPGALADCGAVAPTADAAAMVVFTNLALLFVDGTARERWIVDKVSEIVARSGYVDSIIAVPLGQLYGVADEWGAGWAAPMPNYAPPPARRASTSYASRPPADRSRSTDPAGSHRP
jgi:hypothetical protein